ncbi:MAG: SDR family oxidoreductase [Spongiibacteraceae bacterium]|nr:SDR family oxidoreductase [Spongiibacteraceae bacterium]
MATQQQTRTLLVTGATGGMGRACSLLAAKQGYDLLLSDLDSEKLKTITNECTKLGINADFKELDISDSSAITDFVSYVKNGSKLDGIIHTVGLSPQMAPWDKIIQVDLIGSVELIEGLKPTVTAGSCAVLIASMSGHMVPPNIEIDKTLNEPLAKNLLEKLAALPGKPLSNPGMCYAYAKKALLTYVSNQAMNWGAEGKRIMSLSPGLIDTDMGRLEAKAIGEVHTAMLGMVALQRSGQAEEIASAALFLASDKASYISGCDLLVDGGFVSSFLKQQRAVN